MVAGSGTDIHDILPVYDKVRSLPTTGLPEIGQFILTVTPDFNPPLRIYDAKRANQTTHTQVSGVIRGIDAAIDFKPKLGRLPVVGLHLGNCEEILAIHAKARRCIVLATTGSIADTHLPKAEQGLARPAFQRPSFLVAPLFSVSAPGEPRAITPTIAARAECLVYPQLVFLPRSGGIVQSDSVARLDRAFWTTLPQPTSLYKLALTPERMGILQGQIQVLQGLEPPPGYTEMVQIARSVLAPEYEALLP